MTIESYEKKDIPNLNASDDEWNRYWNSCNISEIVNTLDKLVKKERKEKPIENKFLYMRALECKDAINKIFCEISDKNNKLIKDIELGKD